MAAETGLARRQQLGKFLRSLRERLEPARFGVEASTRRRTPGLRREELAQLAGLSVTWYTWLEQGRDIALSAHALGRLASVMKLSPAERSYLFDLAGRRDPHAAGQTQPVAPPALLQVLETIAAPAYILDPFWNALGWNAAASALFTGWLDEGSERNLLRFIILSPQARTLIDDWESRARRAIAEFRIDYGHHLDDPAMQGLVDQLVSQSSFFAQEWPVHAVLRREGGVRCFNHPARGRITLRQVTLAPSSQPDLKLVVLVDLAGGPVNG